MDDWVYEDEHGNELKVGTKVVCETYNEGTDDPQEFHGEVISISDPDGDVDDYGRSIQIWPKVTVRFNDGTEDSFGFGYDHNHEVFHCADIIVLT